MRTAKQSATVKLIAILLFIVMLCPSEALAVESRASYYLSGYGAYVYPAGWGKVQVWFEVDGTNDMDEIGALEIQLFESTDNENWTWVKTYRHDNTSGMLGYNKIYHSGYVEYSGTIGRYYKAYVCIWAGADGNGDTRYLWTHSQKATLLPG